MKKGIFLLILASVLLTLSCTKVPNDGKIRLTVTALSESTKTTLGEPIDGARAISWVKGDAIKVFFGNNASDFVIADASDEGPTTTFTVDVPSTASMLYAVYPASTPATFHNGVISIIVPASQDGSFASANIAVARSSAVNPNFSFKHVCSYVLTEVTDENICKMTLTANGQHLCGTIPVTLLENGDITFGEITDASSSLSATIRPGHPILALLPGVSFSEGVSIEFFNADGDPVSSRSLKKDFTLNRGNILNTGN